MTAVVNGKYCDTAMASLIQNVDELAVLCHRYRLGVPSVSSWSASTSRSPTIRKLETVPLPTFTADRSE